MISHQKHSIKTGQLLLVTEKEKYQRYFDQHLYLIADVANKC